MTSPDASALACRELVELVTLYLEGALAPEDRRRFEEHLAGCPGCLAYLGQIRAVVRIARALGGRVDAP